MAERNVKLALVQMNSVKGDLDENLNTIEKYAKAAGKEHADLIVFPELCTCGYYSDVYLHHREQASFQTDDGRMKRLMKIAKENHLNMVVGTMLRREDTYTNSAVLIDDSGKVLHIHDKVFLWDDENLAFSGGKEFSVIEMPFGKLGMMICYDAGFPENARSMALQGAELIVTPAAFAKTKTQRYRWETYFRSRALENTCYVVGINAAGGEGENIFFGNNVLFDPNGYQISAGCDDTEEMQMIQIDLNKADWSHKMESYLGEIYKRKEGC